MTLDSRKIGDVLVVPVSGRLDAHSAPQLQDDVLAWIAEGNIQVLLEMSDLAYVSSAGLRATLVITKKLQEKAGRFALCGLGQQVAEVFRVSGFDSILDIHPDDAAALAAMGAGGT